MDLDQYKTKYGSTDDAAPGWDAIDAALANIYGEQKPQHFGTAIKYMLGGPDPIDGLSIYSGIDDKGEYLHIVTYGFSSLYYDEEAVGGDFSKFGFELTMRLRPESEDDNPPMWAMNMLQNIARYVFDSGKWFEPGHYMPANGPIKQGSPTQLVGLVVEEDPELGTIRTVHGQVQFLQVFGVTEKELVQMKEVDNNANQVLAKHRGNNPLLVTRLSRGEK